MARTAKKAIAMTPEEKLAQALVPEGEQPYQVPDNWCWVHIGAVSILYTGNSINETIKKEKYYGQPVGLLYIATKDISFDCTIDYETNVRINDFEKYKIAPANTALLCIEGGSAGRKIGFVNQDVCFVNKLCAFVANTINSKFIFYYLLSQNFSDQFNARKHGLIGGVSVNELSTVPFTLPPLAEQQRIVDRIESLFAKLDEAKEKAQTVVDGFEDRKAAILHKAFTGELTGGWRKTVGKSISEWRTVTVGEISDVKGGKRVPKGMSLTDSDTGHPYIKAGNLKQGTVIDNGISYVPDEVLPYIKNYTVNAGDVYITNVGACIGDCGVIPSQFDGANLTENAVKMTNLKCVSEYLAWYLSSSSVQQLIKTLIASATLGKLSIANIKTIPVHLPSDEEQSKIVETISHLLEKEQQAKETAEQVIDQIDFMKKSILARAFRGELGTNDPADESAEELLKRIL